MRTIDDLEHFVLGEGETLILRFKRPVAQEVIETARAAIAKNLPGRPVVVLPSEVEVCAGVVEVMGAPPDALCDESPEVQEQERRDMIEAAYDKGMTVWCREAAEGGMWFYIHRQANSITRFDWDLYDYSLTKPARRE